MTTPCDNCPFRSDVKPYILPERVIEIRDSLVAKQQSFPCHKTTKPSDSDYEEGDYTPRGGEQQCAGAMILMEKNEQSTQLMRISERLGMYDRRKLVMDAPVYASFAEMLRAHRSSERRSKITKGPPGGAAIWEWACGQEEPTIGEAMEHFCCSADDIFACMDDELPDDAEYLGLIAGYSGGGGIVELEEEEQEIEAL